MHYSQENLINELATITQHVTEWEKNITMARRHTVQDGQQFTLDEERELRQCQVIRMCCEAALACAQDKHLTTTNLLRSAVYLVDTLRTTGK